MRIATLGPFGTCSEEAALGYLASSGDGSAPVLLESFEAAVAEVLGGRADAAMVPAAYVNFHELVFRNVGALRVKEILYTKPVFVLAAREGRTTPPTDRPARIASHRSPSPLLSRVTFPFVHVEAGSNAVSARLAQAGETDFCVTNRFGLESLNRRSAPDQRLALVELYGAIDMVWALFERGAAADRSFGFWTSGFEKLPSSAG